MECGCKIESVGANPLPQRKIVFCPLHAAAPEMREALAKLVIYYDRDDPDGVLALVLSDARTALTKAAGK